MYDRPIVKDTFNNLEQSNNIVPNPWRRFFARSFDMSLYSLIVTIVLLYVFRVNPTGSRLSQNLEMIAVGIIMLFVEPLFLFKLGTTPGKSIFGLKLRNNDGNNITYIQGLWRTFYVIKDGCGFNIPFYILYRNFKSFKICTANEEMSWDYGFSYELKDTKVVRIFGYVGAMTLVVGLVVIVSTQARLPINRGNITPEEYYENCNDFAAIHNIDFGTYLNKNGEWIEDYQGNDNLISIFELEILPYEVIYENGAIQKVIAEVETTNDHFIFGKSNQLIMTYAAFVGADRSFNGFELYNSDIIKKFDKSFSNFSFEVEGYKITNTVEYSGYAVGNQFLIPKDDEEQYFHMKFVVESL